MCVGHSHSKSVIILKRPRRASFKRRSTRWRKSSELGLDEAFELDDRTPALLRGARDEVVEVRGGMGEPKLPQLVTQRRRDRVG
jgi:hypothetical protein